MDEPIVGKAYRTTVFPGIAVTVVRRVTSATVAVRMVGDDSILHIAKSSLSPLSPEDYCAGCGQIGCGCYGY